MTNRDINEGSDIVCGWTLFQWAELARNIKIVKALVGINSITNNYYDDDYYADSNSERDENEDEDEEDKNEYVNKSEEINSQTPLHWAASSGYVEVVRLLIENFQINSNAKRQRGSTPLHLAVKQGHVEITRLLIHHVEIVKLLLHRGADVHWRNDVDRTPLFAAANNGNDLIVKLLVDMGVFDFEVDTPLGLANGHVEVAKLLIDKVADVNLKGDYSLLHLAAEDGQIEVLNLLLDKGTDVNTSFNYEAPQCSATKNRQIKAVKLLLNKGADINVARYALCGAALNGQIEIMKLLLDEGADINAKIKYDMTPLHNATENGKIERNFFLSSGPTSTPLESKGQHYTLLQCNYKHIDVAKLLLKKGVNVNAKNNDSDTALHKAVCKGRIEMAKLFLDKGAEMNAMGKHGMALHCAVKNRYIKGTKPILNKGAEVNAKNNNNWTVLNEAALMDHIEMAKLLLGKNADVNAKSNNNRTALYWAALKGHFEMAKLLLDNGMTKTSEMKRTIPHYS
ncbi:LOW QUALITY PROTEIN: ankyrin repeat-containing domain protein [Jimgerdemannia flammicorona]|uniref:Ankyrin repeat-containing domain protein n=1 Tax=Jimgerdemannia flammicorona TaxID=994334 RepID=A0A433DCU4_9FUNG|nr:LOW QUALITY PROTEIN: ankyrin repeat-containing domain protein [Jimgerdemannia flammicorona]